MKANRLGVGSLSLLAGLGLLGAIGPSPAAAVAQVGQAFTPSGGAAACGNDRTWLQYNVPSDGVITQWRFQADGAPPQLKFKVGRPSGVADEFTIVGESDLKTPAAGQLNTYSIRLPVLAGDLIGFYTATMGDCLKGGTSDPMAFSRLGEATAGGTSTFMQSPGLIYDIAAALEPDCDADGFGDESQDPAVDCVLPETQITKGPKPKTHKKKATFEFSSSESSSSFECSLNGSAFAACTSPDAVKAKRGRNSFAVRARDAAGNVDGSPASVDWKFKKKRKRR